MARCTLCNDLTKRHESHLELSFDFTLNEIARSALHDRCESCLVIHEGLRQAQGANWSSFGPMVRRAFARCHGEHGGHADTLHLVVTFIDEAPSLRLEFYSLQAHAWRAILPRPVVSYSPLSPHALTWATAQIDSCNQTHVSCKKRQLKQLPKRLLSLEENTKDDIKVRLVEIKPGFCDAYAALSHCWGQERGLITTERSLKDRKRYISWGAIPKTFQDAIRLALKLNIGFLWIDSLCILQDDLKDWEVESSKMADIYEQASLTLAATTSSASSQGAYSRSPRVAKHTEIILPARLSACKIGIRERVRHWNKTTANDAKQFPLLSRGWVLQERLLSRRILHFCDTELIWECREVSSCECGSLDQDQSPGALFYTLTKNFEAQKARTGRLAIVEDLPSLWDRLKAKSPSSRLRKSWLGPASPLQSTPPPKTPASTRPATADPGWSKEATLAETSVEDIPDFVSHYHRLVEQYSALRLTRATDRLTAFSGLTERMQHFRSKYVAGLWSDSICFDLMWRIDKHAIWEAATTRPKTYCGPSWSWVSAIGPVQYWSDTINYKDTVRHFLERLAYPSAETQRTASTPLILNRAQIKHSIRIPGKNPFGSVEYGVLTVEASATTASLRIFPYRQEFSHATRPQESDPCKASFGMEMDHLLAGDGSKMNVPLFADYLLNLPGPHMLYEGAELTLLLVHPDVSLVLRRQVRAEKYVYIDGEPAWERIGIARLSEVSHEDGVHADLDWMVNSEVKVFRIV